MLLFGIMGVGLYFFTTSRRNAVDRPAPIPLGQVTGWHDGARVKDKVCELGRPSRCTNKIRVNVLNYPDSEAIGPSTLPQCLDAAGNLSDVTSFAPGDADQVVLIWVCYEWALASKIPYLNLGNMANGSRLIQAATTFRTEPYK